MSRVSLAADAVSTSGYPTAGTTVAQNAADATNFQMTTFTGKEIILAYNTDDTDPFTVTITSSTDSHGRTKDIATESVPALTLRMYGPFKADGWQQANQQLYFQASNAAIVFSVIRFN